MPSLSPVPLVVSDCVLSDAALEQTPCVFSGCSLTGYQARYRRILQYPANGGAPCNDTTVIVQCTRTVSGCPTCSNGLQDGGEVDVDCGGASSCRRCGPGQACAADTDCATGLACTSSRTCVSTTLVAQSSSAADPVSYVTNAMSLQRISRAQFVASTEAVTSFKRGVLRHVTSQSSGSSSGVTESSVTIVSVTESVITVANSSRRLEVH